MTPKIAAAGALALFASVATAQVAVPLPAPVRPERPQVRPTPLPAPVPPVARPQPLPAPVYPGGPGHSWDQSHSQGRYFAGTVRCESQNYRTRTCRARTQNRVEIVQVHGGSCQRNRSFSYDFNGITVMNGCRATFAYGTGNVRPKASGGNSALPWVLAGAGATAGMIAIANSGSNTPPPPPEARPAPVEPVAPPPPPPPVAPAPPATPQPPFPSLPPASIDANIQFLTPDQQRVMQVCLMEGARQVGNTGGTALRFDGMNEIQPGNGGWRFTFRATGTWPDQPRSFRVLCRATPTSIVEFTPTRL